MSPDTMVPGPGKPQAFNRYSYVLNNPLKHIDLTGNEVECLDDAARQALDDLPEQLHRTSAADPASLELLNKIGVVYSSGTTCVSLLDDGIAGAASDYTG